MPTGQNYAVTQSTVTHKNNAPRRRGRQPVAPRAAFIQPCIANMTEYSRCTSAAAVPSKRDGDKRGPQSVGLVEPPPPSELLAYYRNKVEALADDHQTLQRRLDRIGDVIGDKHSLSLELRQREAEVSELQRALSDIQVYLFQEREHVLRLYAENDRLKIRELDDRRKIQHLLQLSGLGPAEVTYFLKEDAPGAPHSEAGRDSSAEARTGDKCTSGLIISPLVPSEGVLEVTASGRSVKRNPAANDRATSSIAAAGPVSDGTANANNTAACPKEREAGLQRQLECAQASLRSLSTQLAEQVRAAREQIDALLDERKVLQADVDAGRKRQEEQSRLAGEQLKRCQDLLYDSTKEFLAQRNQFKQAEKVWLAEKDKLHRRLEVETNSPLLGLTPSGVDVNSVSRQPLPSASIEPGLGVEAWRKREEQIRQTLVNLENQLEQQQKLADMYREQVIQLEEELVQSREDNLSTKDVFKDHSSKLAQRLQLMSKRYKELEKRRFLEMEGYRTDIGALRKKLQQVEKQLLKLTLGLSNGLDADVERPKDVDLAILEQVRASTTTSTQLLNELKSLKLKVYSLEDEFRNV